MTRLFESRTTPAALAGGAYDTSQTIAVGHGTHVIDRINIYSSSSVHTNAIALFVYQEGSQTVSSYLGSGWVAQRSPLVLKGPFEVTGSGYIQLMFWIPDVGDTANIVIIFRRPYVG